MSDQCDNQCESCGQDCASRQQPADFREAPNPGSRIKKVIGVVSGKGGVGKSLVTSLLAVQMHRAGYKTAILDADITGPSIPRAFGLAEKAKSDGTNIYPVETKTGIPVMSVNLILANDRDPVVWRGPIIAGTVKQFWTDVAWGDVDYLFVDMPPGTGDVPLTVFQSLPVDGIVIVTTPQELVSMIVAKAVKMAELMDIPALSLVENMSYVQCPHCSEQLAVFGESHVEETAGQFGIETTDKLPLDPAIAALCDAGNIEEVPGAFLQATIKKLCEM